MASSTGTSTLAALSAGCVALLYAMMIVFQSNDRPWVDGARMWLPFVVSTLPPYLFVLWRLHNRPADSIGLGVAVACAVLSILTIVWYARAVATVREQAALNVFVSLLYWHVTGLVAVFVFIPLQLKLGWNALGTLSSSGPGSMAGALAMGAVLAGAYYGAGRLLLKPLSAGAALAAEKSEYAASTADRHLLKLYKCLWRDAGPGAVNGFPPSEQDLIDRGPECWDPVNAPGGSGYGTYFEFRYTAGPPDADGKIRSFGIATKKRNAPGTWTDSFFLDQLGIMRRSVERWATAETDRIESYKASTMAYITGVLDAYHDVYGGYPVRLIHPSDSGEAGPNDLVLTEQLFAVRGAKRGPAGASVLDRHEYPMVYTPTIPTPGGRATGYLLAVRSGYNSIHDFRSYLVENGIIHGTGEDRDATVADPVAPEIEWPPRAREQMRELAGKMLRGEHGQR